jgi:hypothetical protein
MEDILLCLYWSNLEKVIVILLYKSDQKKLLFYCYLIVKFKTDPLRVASFRESSYVYK